MIGRGWKARDEGEKEAANACPVPESATVGTVPGKLPETERLPVSGPRIVGVNVTLTEQLAPAASEPMQLLACVKSPERLMAERV